MKESKWNLIKMDTDNHHKWKALDDIFCQMWTVRYDNSYNVTHRPHLK